MDIFDKSQTQPGSGEGCSNITSGTPILAPVKKVALNKGYCKSMGRRTEIEFEAGLAGRSRNTGRSPLTTISQARILGARVGKDMCLPREACCVSIDVTYCNSTGLTGKTGETKPPALGFITSQTLMSLTRYEQEHK
jgi:hypothetical protein